MSMAQWIFLSELDQARHLYLDAYKQLHGAGSPILPKEQWNDCSWLDVTFIDFFGAL